MQNETIEPKTSEEIIFLAKTEVVKKWIKSCYERPQLDTCVLFFNDNIRDVFRDKVNSVLYSLTVIEIYELIQDQISEIILNNHGTCMSILCKTSKRKPALRLSAGNY